MSKIWKTSCDLIEIGPIFPSTNQNMCTINGKKIDLSMFWRAGPHKNWLLLNAKYVWSEQTPVERATIAVTSIENSQLSVCIPLFKRKRPYFPVIETVREWYHCKEEYLNISLTSELVCYRTLFSKERRLIMYMYVVCFSCKFPVL